MSADAPVPRRPAVLYRRPQKFGALAEGPFVVFLPLLLLPILREHPVVILKLRPH